MGYETVLIDGDIIIYRAACGVEKEFRWPDGVWTYAADEQVGIDYVNEQIRVILEKTGAKDYILCLSDTQHNFRKDVMPTYKGNRDGIRKPLILSALRNYCMMKLQVAELPNIEADDVMGIMATENPGCIIATVDKDLLQIPAPVYNMDSKEISLPEHRDCERLFYKQVLMGDQVDGYSGCPGVGSVAAEEILDNPFLWEEYEHTFKSGKRKGETELRWRRTEAECTLWESIVSHYEKAGLTEEDALRTARVAYILQFQDYCDAECEPKLWEPNND